MERGTSTVRAREPLASRPRTFRPDVVVELGDSSQHAFHQLARRRVVDCSVADRSEIPSDFRCARSAKSSYFSRANRVRLKTTTNCTLPLLMRQYWQELLELCPIRRLRTLAFFAESGKDVEAVALAVLLTSLELRRQAQVLGLLFRANTDVDDRADHRRHLRPILRGDRGRVGYPRCQKCLRHATT